MGVTCGDASTTVTYVQAWEYWASGRPDNECLVLWGLSLRWWGRIGQLVAFIGSLLLVADLVNLPSVAESFRDVRSTFRRAATAAWELRGEVIGITVLIFVVVGYVYHEFIYRYQSLQREVQCIESTGKYWGCLLAELWPELWGILALLITILGGGIGFVILFVFIAGCVIPNFILAPLIWVLRVLPRWAKALNLILIVVAFHFSLLAS